MKKPQDKEANKKKLVLWPAERQMPLERDYALEVRGIRAQIEEQCQILKNNMQENNWVSGTKNSACVQIDGQYYEFFKPNK